MNDPTNRIKAMWVVDPTPVNGNWLVRVDDGTYSGDIVAEVHGLALAECIVADHNFVNDHEEL